ncbi:MAG: thioesterase family protein [Thioalkalispiraceae bacterium]|jgi:acyl-CoA thioester hydrolase
MKAIVSEKINITVQFFECDPMAVCWHGHYVKYFEMARCAVLKKIGYDYPDMKASGYAWPVIDLHIRYIRALRYDQQITIEAGIIEYENYLKIIYEVRDTNTGERLTKGTTKQVAVTGDTFEMQLVSPNIVSEKLARYL